LFSNVSKFNKGKENLNSLLAFQKPDHNKFGIGFVKSRPPFHVSHAPKHKHHAYLYASSSKHKPTKICNNLNTCDSIFRHSSHVSTPSTFIWIPKNTSMHVRDKYILDFRQNICKSENYFCINRGKPNSKWVWFPKS
jgi:hypothetical protein